MYNYPVFAENPMEKDTDMIPRLNIKLLLWILPLALLAACGAPPTPQTITLVETVPVEVTRLVEVERLVEVTREVPVTVVVEQPVTVTPSATPQVSPTPEPSATPTFTLLLATATVPEGKVEGWAPLKVHNRTDVRLTLEISGAANHTFVLSAGDEEMRTVPEGDYTYIVSSELGRMYTGSFSITNPDKHELIMREDKAVFWMP